MKKKAVAVMMGIVLSMAVLVGCGAKGNAKPQDVKVGSLKGPTSMGLVYLMDQAEKNEAANNYEFKMAAAADELLPSMISGDLDIV